MSTGDWSNPISRPQFPAGTGPSGAGFFASPPSTSSNSIFGAFNPHKSSTTETNLLPSSAPSKSVFRASASNASGEPSFGSHVASSVFGRFSNSGAGLSIPEKAGRNRNAEKVPALFGTNPSLGRQSQAYSVFGNTAEPTVVRPEDGSALQARFSAGASELQSSFKPDSILTSPKSSVFGAIEIAQTSSSHAGGSFTLPAQRGALSTDNADKCGQSSSLFGPSQNMSSRTNSSQSSSIFGVKLGEIPSVESGTTIETGDQSSPLTFRPVTRPFAIPSRKKRSFDEDGSMQNPQITSSVGIRGGIFKKRSVQGSQSLKSMSPNVKNNTSPQLLEDSFEEAAKLARKPTIHHAGIRPRKTSLSALAEQAAALTSSAIVCYDVSPEMNNQHSLREHFNRFGVVTKIIVMKAKNMATIAYETHEMAAAAKLEGSYVDERNSPMKIFFKKMRKSSDKSPVQQSASTEPGQPHRPVSRFKIHPSQFPGFKAKPDVKTQSLAPVYACTDNEKLAILEKIDTLLRKRVVRQSDIKKAKTSKGTCPDMCPEKERFLRQHRKLLASYEMVGGNVDHFKAIKEYSRSSADQDEPLPHELRPASVLRMTMHYLLAKMMPRLYEGQVADWYDFVWNRTRAIRKELTIQQISDINAININEQCARFHIFCAHQLCGQDSMVFPPKINNENLEKTIKTIMDLYQEVYFVPESTSSGLSLQNSNVAELYSYYIMLNINKTADVLNELQELRPEIRRSPDIGIAVEAFMAVHSNNFVKFFKIVKVATFLQGCILHRYFPQVRRRAALTISKAFKAAPGKKIVSFPIEDFMRILCFNDENELQTFCQHYGILINDNMLEFNRSGLEEQDSSLPSSPSELILVKVEGQSLAEMIAKCNLELETHTPYSSFDETGRYIGEHLALLSSGTFQALQPAQTSGETSTSITKMLPPGVTNNHVKVIAKELFHEVIDEICLPVSKEIWDACVSRAIIIEIFQEVTDAVMAEECQLISSQTMNEAVEQKRIDEEREKVREEERTKKEEMERVTKRQRELQKLEETKRRENIMKEKEKMKLYVSEILAEEILLEVEDDFIKSTTEKMHGDLLREVRIEWWSNEEQEHIIADVVINLARVICTSTWREMKEKTCSEIFSKFKLWQLRRTFKKWHRQKTEKLKLQTLTKTFPNVPLSRSLNAQIRSLFPNQKAFSLSQKRSSFPLDTTTELSLQSPMEIVHSRKRCKTFFDNTKPKMEELYKCATLPLPFCDMLATASQKCNFVGSGKDIPRSILWKIGLKLPGTDNESSLQSWLKCAFVGACDNCSTVFNTRKEGSGCINICVSCRVISEENLRSDAKGTFSLVLGLPQPQCYPPSQQYLALARTWLENLISSRPAVPPIPLLIVLLDWDAEPDMLDEQLGLSLLNFAFSRWMVCSLEDCAESVLDNYQKLLVGIRFLFDEMPELPSLRTVSMKDLFENTLAQEYVTPLCDHGSRCREAHMLPLEPNIQVEFFNFVIDALASALNNEDFEEISWPATEFSKLSEIELPQQEWNSEETLSNNFEAMQKCKVPPFPDLPITLTESGIMDMALVYAESVSPQCPALISTVKRRVNMELQKLVDEIPLTDDSPDVSEEEILKGFNWHFVIDCIISQHLTNVLYHSELGSRIVTFPIAALSNIEKHASFGALSSTADYFSINQPTPEKNDFSRTLQSGMVEDLFSNLDYSLPPSYMCEPTWAKEVDDVSKAVMDTENLHDSLKRERELNAQNEDRLQALLQEGDMPLDMMDSAVMCSLLSDISFVF